jgi:hypothetical protein
MKNYLFIILLFASCKKEVSENCDCGTNLNYSALWADPHQLKIHYITTYRNDCSGNVKRLSEVRYVGTGRPEWYAEDIYCDSPW